MYTQLMAATKNSGSKPAKSATKSNEPIEKLDIFTIGLYCPEGRFDAVGKYSNYT